MTLPAKFAERVLRDLGQHLVSGLLGFAPEHLRHARRGEHGVRGAARHAAHGLGRHVRRIGFGEQQVARRARDRIARVLAALERERAA